MKGRKGVGSLLSSKPTIRRGRNGVEGNFPKSREGGISVGRLRDLIYGRPNLRISLKTKGQTWDLDRRFVFFYLNDVTPVSGTEVLTVQVPSDDSHTQVGLPHYISSLLCLD